MKINLSIPGQFCSGLGDCIVWSWIANGPTPLEFYVGGRNREMFELLGQRVTSDPTGARDPSGCYVVEKARKCNQSRLELWCEFLRIECVPVRPKVAIPEAGVMARRVALCPHTHHAPRAWPSAYWVDLCWNLKKRNLDPIWIMEHEDKAILDRCGGVPYYWGFGMADVATMLASSAIVIGNDSMPVHLAGTIGRPCIAMNGPTNPNVFAHLPSVGVLQSKVTECVGCHFAKPYRAACDLACQALLTLDPATVCEVACDISGRIDATRRVSEAVFADKAPGRVYQRRGS